MEVALILAVSLAVAYVRWRGWPWRECRRCKGKGRYTRKTLILGRRVARDCPACAGGWVKRFGGKR